MHLKSIIFFNVFFFFKLFVYGYFILLNISSPFAQIVGLLWSLDP